MNGKSNQKMNRSEIPGPGAYNAIEYVVSAKNGPSTVIGTEKR